MKNKATMKKESTEKTIYLRTKVIVMSTLHGYCISQSEFHLQWAANKLKFKDYLSAALDINKAYRLLQKNQKIFPNFEPIQRP